MFHLHINMNVEFNLYSFRTHTNRVHSVVLYSFEFLFQSFHLSHTSSFPLYPSIFKMEKVFLNTFFSHLISARQVLNWLIFQQENCYLV